MTIMQRISHAVARSHDDANLPELYDQIDRDMRDNVHRLNEPAVLANDADDKIRRHITVSTQELRQMVEEMETRTQAFRRIAEDFIRASEDGAAEIAAQVRAHTTKLTTKIEALKD